MKTMDIITLYNTLRMLKAIHADTTEIEAEIKRREERIKHQTLDEFLAENYRPMKGAK